MKMIFNQIEFESAKTIRAIPNPTTEAFTTISFEADPIPRISFLCCSKSISKLFKQNLSIFFFTTPTRISGIISIFYMAEQNKIEVLYTYTSYTNEVISTLENCNFLH